MWQIRGQASSVQRELEASLQQSEFAKTLLADELGSTKQKLEEIRAQLELAEQVRRTAVLCRPTATQSGVDRPGEVCSLCASGKLCLQCVLRCCAAVASDGPECIGCFFSFFLTAPTTRPLVDTAQLASS